MDSRAKQRLTGAVILVALFVLLVPELLKGPRTEESTAGVQTDEEGLRKYTIDLDSPTPATAPAVQPAMSLPPIVEKPRAEIPRADAPVAENPLSAAPAPALATPGEAAAPEIAVLDKPVVAATPKPAPANASAPAPAVAAPVVAVPVVAAPKPDVSATKPVTPRPTAATGKTDFAVQLGSFGSRENADRLVRDMTAKGFNAFVAPITSGGRELYRVRVGPARDRAAAEALAVQLRRVGQSGSIVPIS